MPQSLSKIYVHLVFSTKGRTETIPKTHLAEVHAYVAEIFNNHGCPAIQVGGTANHIHILFLLGKQANLSEIVRTVKSSTTRWQVRYNEVKNFIEENHRNPSKYRIEEHDMLNWVKANRKVMNAGKMKPERAEAFKKLLEMMEECKRVNQYVFSVEF